MASTDFIRLTVAVLKYGVSHNKLWGMVKDGTLKAYDDPRDKRVTLLSRASLMTSFKSVLKKEGRGCNGILERGIVHSVFTDERCRVHSTPQGYVVNMHFLTISPKGPTPRFTE